MKLNIKRKITQSLTAREISDQLLSDRGIVDREAFMLPPHPADIEFGTFFKDQKKYKKDFNKTLKLLKAIHKSGQTVVVYSDYDADGVTGGAILWETLHRLGFKTMPYIPDRKTEGYGFSKVGLDNVKKQFDPGLVISVDHGIVAHAKIAYARSLGIPIVITDHHQKLATDPEEAFAIFHTGQVSGAGVAYFFAKEIYESYKKQGTSNKSLENNFLNDYVSLAAIGTIADLVPLTGAARSLAKHGLASFSKTARPGLRQMLIEAQIADRAITPYDIGFIIAPRINAFGRLTHAIDALRLLCTRSETRARQLAALAGDTNKKRQTLVENSLKEAETMVNPKDKIIILAGDWEEGIIGLIASKLTEKYYRPTIIMTKSDGFAKASARSIADFDITAFLRSLKKYLVDVGGHAAAAGFTIEANKVDNFIKAAKEKAQKLLTKELLTPTMKVDLELPLSVIDMLLAKEMETLNPFGIGNPRPVFKSRGELIDAKLIGKNHNHLKLILGKDNNFPLEMIFFGQGEKLSTLSRGKINVVYTLEVDRWNGREKVKGMGKLIVD